MEVPVVAAVAVIVVVVVVVFVVAVAVVVVVDLLVVVVIDVWFLIVVVQPFCSPGGHFVPNLMNKKEVNDHHQYYHCYNQKRHRNPGSHHSHRCLGQRL